MITTYEKPSRVFIVQQYGWKPVFEAYRIKNYKMRLVKDIKTHSLRRLEKLVKSAYPVHTSMGENWFKTEHKPSKNILDYPDKMYIQTFTDESQALSNKVWKLYHSARWHTNIHIGVQLCFCGPYIFYVKNGYLMHLASGYFIHIGRDNFGTRSDEMRYLITFLENTKNA